MFRLKLLTISLIVIWISISVFVAISMSPFTPILPQYKTKFFIKLFIPEGWGFFTRNPREQMLYLYKKVNSTWILDTFPNSYFYFGAGRDMRIQGVEVSKLMEQINATEWDNANTISSCLTSNRIKTVKNSYFYPKICGDYLLILQEQVPWAWSRNEKKIVMPIKFVKLKVICGK